MKTIEKQLKETDQPRVSNIIYEVVLYDKNNEEIDDEDFELGVSDLLFGTK